MSSKYHLLGTIWVIVIIAALITYSFVPAYAKERGDLYQPYEYSQMLLEGEPYPEVVIEYDYMEGQEPDETSMNILEEKVERYTDKESVETVVDQEIDFEDRSASYDSNDISELKDKYQDHERGGNQIPIHVLYLNGVWEDNPDVLGLSQRPEQIVIFSSVISNIERENDLESAEIETPVLVHEFGHLLSLVGLNYESDHEDEEYPHHCDESAGDCVMAGSVEIKEDMAEDPPTHEFCELCQEDLETIRGLEDPFGLEDVITYSSIVGQYMVGIWASTVLVEKAGKDERGGNEPYRMYEYYGSQGKTSKYDERYN